jgi:hypothetical protein
LLNKSITNEERNIVLNYKMNNGVIESEKGIPASPRWFADNRLALQFVRKLA